MSEHTKEPWKIGPHGLNIIDPATGFLVAYTHANNLNRVADIRRIVACVNACAGISTEYMEKFSATTFNDFKRMKEQRDELLAALVKAADFIQPYNVASELLEELDAVIAKVKP